MAVKKGTYIAVNELYGLKSGSPSKAIGLVFNGQSCRYAKINGVVRYDKRETYLSASDFTMGVSGGDVRSALSVSSYSTDALGNSESLYYTVSPTTIGENQTTETVAHDVTITQYGSYESLVVKCYQEAKDIVETGLRYEVSITRTYIATAPASGSDGLSLAVSGNVKIYKQYSDGSETYDRTEAFSSVTATVLSGYGITGASIVNGKVKIPSAGTTPYTGNRLAYTISNYSFVASGQTFNGGSVSVYQSENRVTGQEWGTGADNYLVTISSATKSFTSSGGTATINISCRRQYRDVYTSGSKGSWVWGDGTATISTTYGTLSGSSITGSGKSVTLTVGKDEGNGYTSKITASAGGGVKTASIEITQTVRAYKSTTYNKPTITGTSIGTASAKGDTLGLSVTWVQTSTILYDNDTMGAGSTYNGTSIATVTNGSGIECAYISGGKVVIPSAGTTPYDTERTAYTITAYTYAAQSGTWDGSGSIVVKQSANTRTSTTEYSVSTGVASINTIANTGGSFTCSATCQSRPKYTYASGSTENGSWVDAKATVSYSNGVSSVSPTSFTGSTTITATIGENTSSQRYPRVTVKAANDISVSDYTQVTQSAVSYTFTAISTTNVELEGTSTSFSVSVRSERNGKPWAISTSNVSAGSYASVSGVVQSSYPTYQYNINFTTTSNTSSTNRSYSVTVTQPSSGNKLTFNVTHKTVSSGLPIEMVWKYSNGNYCTSNGWYLGQIPTGATTNGRPVYHIVAVTTKANSQTASIYTNFTYTYNPSDAAGNISGSINKSFSYSAGATISVNGKSYYGVILVSGLPAISQGTVTSFSVSKT